MSTSGPRMSTFHKRLYTALPRVVPSGPSVSSSSAVPRVRSNSASSSRTLYTASTSSSPLSFFDTGVAPPSSRPHVVARLEGRVEVELHTNAHTHGTNHQGPQGSTTHGGNHGGGPPPWSLALTSPYSNPSSPHNSPGHNLTSFLPFSPFSVLPTCSAHLCPSPETRPYQKRQRARYHLDVGAYGIAKRRSRIRSHELSGLRHETHANDLPLAVSVGEDAYFVRDNAMGVADGVGGWSRMRDPETPYLSSPESTASALFARRLMHYCSAELDYVKEASSRGPSTEPYNSLSPNHGKTGLPHMFPSSPLHPPAVYCTPVVEVDELYDQLEDSLEELEEGLDVLMILERAYEQTLKAHVLPTSADPSCGEPRMVVPAENVRRKHTDEIPITITTPLSDPAVDALEHRISSSLRLNTSTRQSTGTECKPLLAGSSTALVAILDHCPSPLSSDSSGEVPSTEILQTGAVLRIAHLGDSMGMLVRGGDIVWRSEEMWSHFNTPLQLGPRSATKPADAQIITIPVQADDILILASDGLSDNLWDEEVLDEVVRFRRTFLRPHNAQDAGVGAPGTSINGLLGRRTLAGMLSEALCSRARQVSERGHGAAKLSQGPSSLVSGTVERATEDSNNEVPFARRARENGRSFRGGKTDDISVVVAVISANESHATVA